MSARVELRDVSRSFAGRRGRRGTAHARGDARPALDRVTLDIAPGEFLCVVGPSGCGKTTLLDLIAGHARPDSGEVLVRGASVRGPGADRIVVFQEHALFPWLTARRNVEFGLRAAGMPAPERRAIAQEWLGRVRLDGAEDLYPHELSGGMRQRAALARALALRPEVLLMDEPFSALDAPSRDRLHVELQDLWRDTGTTIVFVTHNVREAVALGDRVAVMSSSPGRILGSVRVPLSRPRVVESSRVIEIAQEVRAMLDEADQLGIDAPRPGGDSHVSI